MGKARPGTMAGLVTTQYITMPSSILGCKPGLFCQPGEQKHRESCGTRCSPNVREAVEEKPTGRRLAYQSRDEKCGGSGKAAHKHCLCSGAKRLDTGIVTFDRAEDEQSQKSHADGNPQCRENLFHQDVRRERDKAPDDVGHGDRSGASAGTAGVRSLEPELETHHEIHPAILVRGDRPDDRLHLRLGKYVVTKDLGDFLGFDVSQIYGLANFAEAFGFVVLEVR